MSFINSYKPPAPPTIPDGELIYGPDPYEINFAFPLPSAGIRTDHVQLTPFIPAKHAEEYDRATKSHAETLYRYMPYDIAPIIENASRRDSSQIVFAVIDTATGSIAGLVGLINVSPQLLVAEIGPVITIPAFQRTYVTTHAVGALLRYCLDLPNDGGIGLRRVQWTADPNNVASIRAAQRMGLKIEGTMRWTWVLKDGKEGKDPGEDDPVRGKGRDSVMLAICWDDWEEGGRDHVSKLIARE